jgi:hypothetical protein
LRVTRKAKGQREALKHAERREREGGTSDGSLASRRGQCRCIYTSWTGMLRQNEIERDDVKRGASNKANAVGVNRRHAARQ